MLGVRSRSARWRRSMKQIRVVEALLLDYPAACRYLGGISRSSLKALRAAGEVESVPVGRRRMFVRASLDAYVMRLRDRERAS
jgi:hypothetical protein